MLTAKDIMETCWEEDSTYEEVVAECQRYNLPIPSSREYQELCDFNNDAIKEWRQSIDNPYDDSLDTDDEDIFVESDSRWGDE